ncbi:MAG: 50S ribosomal protein L10 [candidate division Zixibacteria bacterium]|nr:50S ribosomal protein L10 [candidate division Zixibacteria bacterium]
MENKMARPEKVTVVENFRSKIKESNSIFLTDYLGLNVADMTELRRNLRQENVSYMIAKNTLIRLAAKEEGLEELEPYLKGPTAVAFGVEDPNVPAKILYESFKAKEKPAIKCFYIDGKLYKTADELKAWASLPTKEELYTQILMGVQSPLTNLIASIEAPMREFVSVLDALAKAKED